MCDCVYSIHISLKTPSIAASLRLSDNIFSTLEALVLFPGPVYRTEILDCQLWENQHTIKCSKRTTPLTELLHALPQSTRSHRLVSSLSTFISLSSDLKLLLNNLSVHMNHTNLTTPIIDFLRVFVNILITEEALSLYSQAPSRTQIVDGQLWEKSNEEKTRKCSKLACSIHILSALTESNIA